MIRTVNLGERRLCYELTRKSVKNINLRVKKDGSVAVSASPRVPISVIEDFIRAKQIFILRAIDTMLARSAAETSANRYETGELLSFWGGARCLYVEKGTRNEVRYDERSVVLTVKDPENVKQKEMTIRTWQAELCRLVMTDLCQKLYPYYKARGVPFPTLRFRFMKSRWGSCNPQKHIVTFNCLLAEKPLACAEYIVAHELTHFLHPDHSKRFYAQLEEVIPDWKARRQRLKQEIKTPKGDTQ